MRLSRHSTADTPLQERILLVALCILLTVPPGYFTPGAKAAIPQDSTVNLDAEMAVRLLIREGDSYTDLLLSNVPGIDGKSTRLYFHCPYCGKRVRYLYRRQEHYMCRNCAKLNYASQQKSGMDEMRLKMERIVEKELGYTWWYKDYPNACISDLWHIPKPRYMRWKKYERLLKEFRQLQKDYERAFWIGLIKISYSREIAQAAIQHINSL